MSGNRSQLCRPRRITYALTALLILTAPTLATPMVTGCAQRNPVAGAQTEIATDNATNADIPRETEEMSAAGDDLRTYYEERLEEMKKTLLNERQERYISEHEYRERLAELERELELLASGAELDTARQVSGQPDTEPDTSPSTKIDSPTPSPEPILHPTSPTPLPSSCFRYTVQDGQVTVTGYLGNVAAVSVPSEIDGCPVVAIGDGAFRSANITAVILPNSVKTIGWFSFADCPSLESIFLPPTLRSISYAAFENCTHLTVLCTRDSYAARWAASYGLPIQYI